MNAEDKSKLRWAAVAVAAAAAAYFVATGRVDLATAAKWVEGLFHGAP